MRIGIETRRGNLRISGFGRGHRGLVEEYDTVYYHGKEGQGGARGQQSVR